MSSRTKRVAKTTSRSDPAQASGLMAQWPKILAVLAIVAGILALWYFLPVAQWIEGFRAWVETQGIWGHVAFAAIYALATVALAPGLVLTLAAGVAFGLAGFPTVIAGATVGAGLAFLVGRYFARGWVEKQVEGNRTFKAIDKAIESEGWKIVGLMRLSPLVPFNLQNYFFGVTPVGFWPYLVTTFFGIMPGTLLYVWIGSLGAAAGTGFGGGEAATFKWVALGVGLLATLAVTVIVSRKAAEKLRDAGIDKEATKN